jgi:hypothetical protein
MNQVEANQRIVGTLAVLYRGLRDGTVNDEPTTDPQFIEAMNSLWQHGYDVPLPSEAVEALELPWRMMLLTAMQLFCGLGLQIESEHPDFDVPAYLQRMALSYAEDDAGDGMN